MTRRPIITEESCKTFYQLQGVYIYPKETRALKTARAPEVVVPVPDHMRADAI